MLWPAGEATEATAQITSRESSKLNLGDFSQLFCTLMEEHQWKEAKIDLMLSHLIHRNAGGGLLSLDMNTVKFPLKLSSIEMVGNSEDTVKPGEFMSQDHRGRDLGISILQVFYNILRYLKLQTIDFMGDLPTCVYIEKAMRIYAV